MSLNTTSKRSLNTSRVSDSTTSLGSPFLCLWTALSSIGCKPRMEHSHLAITADTSYIFCSESQEMQHLIKNRGTEARDPVACISVFQRHQRDAANAPNYLHLLWNPILFPATASMLSLSLLLLLVWAVFTSSLCLWISHWCETVSFSLMYFVLQGMQRGWGVYFTLVMTFLLFKYISEPLCCTAILFAKSQWLW